ncbi:MAG: Por secretion system C-terminal sorting protein [Bacteroidetes bacterium]|jgi:hypothetical protein|nr:Por secretion system C-terminal sorting protein [Bacteroidota bacterium]
MKKILLFIGLFGSSLCLEAQTVVTAPIKTQPTATQNKHFDMNQMKARQPRAGERATSAWLNYASSMDEYLGGGSAGPAELNTNYLFVDSTVHGEFGAGTFSSVWVHHLGDILDVKSDVFDVVDGINWDATVSYQVDSMSIVYAYTRNVTSIDTLVVTVLTNNVATSLYSGYFTGATAANYGTDTLSLKTLNYSMTTNAPTGSGRKTFKVPLTDLDSSSNFVEKAFAIPGAMNVNAGRLFAASVTFKPGYTWNSEDHVDDLNAFFFASYEENGAGTFPTYFDCNLNSVACDYNSSSIVTQDVRYGTAGGWNGKFIPAYAYTAPYAFEHHLISYRVTAPPPSGVGIDEVTANGFSLNQNQPNPFNGQTTISYSLDKGAEKVSVQIFDVTGVKLFERNDSNVKAGNYSVDVNTADYAAGLYFYTINVDGQKLTKKMIAK